MGFLRAQTQDRGQDWIDERILKHGSVFKTSLMGSPTVVIIGQAGNKFILRAEDDVFAAKQPVTEVYWDSQVSGTYIYINTITLPPQ